MNRLISRRTLVRGAAIWGGLALATLSPFRRAIANPVFINDPFQLGVAGGDPTADGFVIWTRLVPDIFDPHALPPEAIEVRWEVADDAAMKKIVKRGTSLAHPELAHSVHVELVGLEPGRDYFYRFMVGAAVSRVGHAKTWPTPRFAADHVRFAVASCQHYGQGYFTAYRDMIAQDPDFILHLGDYIYEIDWGTIVRRTPVAQAQSLSDYRLLHAVYKTDPDLQAAHAHCPWLLMWDDHEVANDYSKDEAERIRDPATFVARRAEAYQAYYEHMPLRVSAMPDAGHATLFQSLNYGDLMEMTILDLRQFRDRVPCATPERHAGRIVDVAQCAEIQDANRSMLGAAQERWLRDVLGRSPSRWNVVAQSLMLAPFDQISGPSRGVYTDNWGGYPAARRRIFDLVQERNLKSAVSLGGDIHSFFVSDIKNDENDPQSKTIMSEFVGTSITSESTDGDFFRSVMPENPHIKYWDDARRGYMLINVDRDNFRADMRTVENVRVRESMFSTQKSFVVENGKPGPQLA